MHDWTLTSILVDWAKGIATMYVKNTASSETMITVHGLLMLRIPRSEEWGPSVSINEVSGPRKTKTGSELLTVEMQSGDVIELEGTRIDIPTIDE